MPDRVADASVVAAIVFEEPEAAVAERALEGAVICAPDLLRYELSNIAWKKARQHPNQRADIEMALARSRSLGVTLVGINELEVFRLAIQTGLTVYDASYLWLAHDRLIPLVTFDRELRRAASSLGLTVAVQ